MVRRSVTEHAVRCRAILLGTLVAALLLLLTSCGGGDDSAGESSTPSMAHGTTPPSTTASATTTTPRTTLAPVSTTGPSGSAGCSRTQLPPGEYRGVHAVVWGDQPYVVVVPASYGDGDPLPLFLHLASGSGDDVAFMAGWRPYLDELDGLMVMVNTTASGFGNPEVLASLIAQIGEDYCVDPQRIHVMGTSWSDRSR
jgi:poly(3-hydroxybutyrate) depolymerase